MAVLKRMTVYGMLLLTSTVITGSTSAAQAAGTPEYGDTSSLELPGAMPVQDYERLLYRWLMTRQYQSLGWRKDKGVRDTGPFINTLYYGTHPAVRIYYSPEVMAWLENDRQGDLPDGSMIVKEMFLPPAQLYQDMVNNPRYREPAKYEAFLSTMVFAWTAMVRDRAGSKDGWFWANPMAPGEAEGIDEAIERQLDTLAGPPQSSFGAPCLRCHGSANSQFTFSDLENIEGFLPEREPLRFLVDTSWRSANHFETYPLSLLKDDAYVQQHYMLPQPLRPYRGKASINAGLNAQHLNPGGKIEKIANDEGLKNPNPAFTGMFKMIGPENENDVLSFPSQWMDQVLPDSHKIQQYITSDNCLGCHGGLGGEPYGVTMFIKTGPKYGDGINVSEYGEWRWSPMGLAGRDPIFHAQLESEMVLLERDAVRSPTPLTASLEQTKHAVTNTCLSCHGAMGQRQLGIDAASDDSLDPNMSVHYFYLKPLLSSEDKPEKNQRYLKYGQLAREGISCAVCHHIDRPDPQQISSWAPPAGWVTDDNHKTLAYALFHNSTGRFVPGPPDQFFGPFENVAELPMKRTLGGTPSFNEFISDSQLCGTCHTINLPNIGATDAEYPVLDAAETNPVFKDYPHSIEQATFLEWQNSVFAADKGAAGSRFKSCQDCHMPGGFETLDKTIDIDQITTQIAAIQDLSFPQTGNRLPGEDIDIPLRDNYTRHEHVGLNVFLLEMFDQFPEILGVDKSDYMTSASNPGVDIAIENMIRQAQRSTATIELNVDGVESNRLKATVSLRNLTGHRFPSGVAFRRAFVEFVVLDGDDVIWGSGRTNAAGFIVGENNLPLKTELLSDRHSYQPHHQVISSQNQVQIYEELNQNAQHEFTTSFIHRVYDIKDNRLLPDGWRASSHFKNHGELMYEFLESTDPRGTGEDPDYIDQGPEFSGGDRLQYDIALPPAVEIENLSVRATLYYQSIPPYWLHHRFSTAPDGQATQRLYFLASHLNLEDTPMANWKLKLVSDSKDVVSD